MNEETKFPCTEFYWRRGDCFKAARDISSCRSMTQSDSLASQRQASQVMIILIREFSTPDEEMKKIVLKARSLIKSLVDLLSRAVLPGALGKFGEDVPCRHPNKWDEGLSHLLTWE